MEKNNQDYYYMNLALEEAKKAYKEDEVPVGAVLVIGDKVIARAHNRRCHDKSALSHAEVLCIKKASRKLKHYILDDATLYVTLEPCLMCSGLLMQSRVKRVVYAASEPKFGSMGSVLDITSTEYKFTHKIQVTKGILEIESTNLLKSFFKEKRK